MGEKVGAFGINWGEIALRTVITVVNTMMACLFFVLVGGVFWDADRIGPLLLVMVLGIGLLIAVWIRMMPVVQVMMQWPHITVYEKGVTVRLRGREADYMWSALTRWNIISPFSYETNPLMLIRGGHVIFYQGDEAALHVTRLIFNGPKLADLIIKQLERLQAIQRAELEAAKWPLMGDGDEFYDDYPDDDLDPTP